MDEAEAAVGSFVMAGCKAPGIFELVEAAFDHVAQGMDCGIDGQIVFEVRDLTAGQRERYGQVRRIDAEMDLGRKATF